MQIVALLIKEYMLVLGKFLQPLFKISPPPHLWGLQNSFFTSTDASAHTYPSPPLQTPPPCNPPPPTRETVTSKFF